MRHIAAFSGGKDSTALLLLLRERGMEFTAVFCDTGWEHPLTYAYIEEINQRVLGGELVRLRNERWSDGMRSLVAKRGRVPSIRARFCTEELKIYPMIDYLKTVDGEATIYHGIRAEESPSRAQLPEREFSSLYRGHWVERPLLHWTAAEVFAMIDRHGIAANPLYRLGAKRVGCFPCILTRHAELRRLSQTLPEVWNRIAELERLSGRSYFPPGFIPDRFCSHREVQLVEDEDGIERERAVYWPSIEDVRRYLLGTGEEQLTLYGETPSCLSVYGLCE